MKMKKKFLPMALATIMILSSAAGCAPKTTTTDKTNETVKNDNATKEETTANSADKESIVFPLKEEVTMTMFALMNGETEIQDTLAFKAATEKTNVKWEVQSVMGVDLTEKRNLLLASGSYPDVFMKAGLPQTDLDKYGAQGIFIDLKDIISANAPNLTAQINERDIISKVITSKDGKIYSLPEISMQAPALPMYFINMKWLENLGLNEPKNIEELYTVLKAFKDGDANGNGDASDEIPLITTTNVKPDLFSTYFGVPYDAGSKFAIVNDEMIYFPTSDQYKELIAFVTRLYKDGILYKDSFTLAHEQQGAIGTAGDVVGSFFDAGAFLTVGRTRDAEYKYLTPFEKGALFANTGATSGTFAISDTCKTPEIAVAWADQFYSEEGGILAWMGVENESYKINADGTWDWYSAEGLDMGKIRQLAGIQGSANHPSIQPEFFVSKSTDKNETYLVQQRGEMTEMSAGTFPVLRFSDTDVKTIASVKADTDVYIEQYMAKVATGELDLESSWAEYLTTLENMGAGKLLELYKVAYEESK